MNLTRRQKLELRFSALKSARRTWERAWKNISHEFVPFRVLGLEGGNEARANEAGDDLNEHIINSTPVDAVDKIAAFIEWGVTSPGREWFGLSTADEELARVQAVKLYLDQCKKIMLATLARSNLYDTLTGGAYPDMSTVATSAIYAEEEGVGVIFTSQPIGTYWLDKNSNGQIDTCFRRLTMNVSGLVKKFGLEKCPESVKSAYGNGHLNTEYTVIHAVLPNDDYAPGLLGPRGYRYASLWWVANDGSKDAFLRVSGYHEFPVFVPRWTTRDGDVYGRGPGWKAYRDCRALQHLERTLAELYDQMNRPAMKATDDVTDPSLLPGDITRVASKESVYEPVLDRSPLSHAIDKTRGDIERHEYRINTIFFVALVMAFTNDNERKNKTATEVDAIRNEVVQQLGPVLESMNNTLLRPLIMWLFAKLDRNNVLPPPPPELDGRALEVQFISVMHQAQQSTGLAGLQMLLSQVLNMAGVRADVLDKVDFDVVVDELGRMLGVHPGIVRSLEQMRELRKAQAQRQQAQEQGQAMLAATEGLRNIGGANPDNLRGVMDSLSPVAAAQAAPAGGA